MKIELLKSSGLLNSFAEKKITENKQNNSQIQSSGVSRFRAKFKFQFPFRLPSSRKRKSMKHSNMFRPYFQVVGERPTESEFPRILVIFTFTFK